MSDHDLPKELIEFTARQREIGAASQCIETLKHILRTFDASREALIEINKWDSAKSALCLSDDQDTLIANLTRLMGV